jgi:hypothetical protein
VSGSVCRRATTTYSTAALQTAAVPEPSSWAMLLAGFTALGLLGWRKARKGAPAAA